jgi:hypothetical protein
MSFYKNADATATSLMISMQLLLTRYKCLSNKYLNHFCVLVRICNRMNTLPIIIYQFTL